MDSLIEARVAELKKFRFPNCDQIAELKLLEEILREKAPAPIPPKLSDDPPLPGTTGTSHVAQGSAPES